jgi:long-chain acyl-CoA synthetase
VWTIDAGGLEGLRALGADITDEAIEERRANLTSDTLATLIYTSGTTGRPKGCRLTHGNLRYELEAATEQLSDLFATENSSTLLFLPLAHVFARVIQVGAIRSGAKLGHTADVKDLVTHLGTFHPTFVLAVPRVFEKVFNSASGKAYADGKGKIFDRAAQTAIAYSRALDAGKPGIGLRARHALFDRLVTRSAARRSGPSRAERRSGIDSRISIVGSVSRSSRAMASPRQRQRCVSTHPTDSESVPSDGRCPAPRYASLPTAS